ncbi:RidA family protein [Psychrobacter sp. T6-5]|uniref:RidA family protein n=1 Tax=Psychrobacter sp. T6-5 TaxID=3457451 RepID=UPI003FD5659F
MSQRKAVFPAGRHSLYEKHGYSATIQSKDLLFVSGQVGSLQDGSAEPDFEKQVILAFENLRHTLEDIVDVTTFHTDPENQLDSIMNIKNTIFKEAPYPAWTAIGVTWLAGFDFEIKVIARIPDDKR